jgi:hypothetical protein
MFNEIVDRHLLSKFRNQECVFFVGAGVSGASGLMTGKQFNEFLVKELNYPWSDVPLSKVAQAYEDTIDRSSLNDHVLAQFGRKSATPANAHHLITKLAQRYCSHIVTTNYDELLEKSLNSHSADYRVSSEDSHVSQAAKKLHLVKFHGTISIPGTIVLTDNDYRNVYTTRPMLRNLLGGLLAEKTFVFVGFSLEDPDFDQIYHGITSSLGDFQRLSYAVQRKPTSISIEDWNHFQIEPWTKRKIRIITADQDDFLTELDSKVSLPETGESPTESLVGETVFEERNDRSFGSVTSSEWSRLETESLRNCEVEVEFQIEDDGGKSDSWFGIRVRGTTNYFHSGYLIYLRGNGYLDVTSIEERSILDGEKQTVSPRDRVVKLDVQMVGDRIFVSVNGRKIVNVHDTLVSWAGNVYLHAWGTRVQLRSIVVKR